MHPLFVEVLSKKDLSRAGELFAIDDRAIVKDLSELLATIKKISNSPYYIDRHNDQSVVEICLTRIISAIRYILFRNLNTKIPIILNCFEFLSTEIRIQLKNMLVHW